MSTRRKSSIRYVAEIDEDNLECSEDTRKAFKVLKKALRDDKSKLHMYYTRSIRLAKENLLLKERLKWNDCLPEDVLQEFLQMGSRERKEPVDEKFTFQSKIVRPAKKLTCEMVGKIVCRLCFGQASTTRKVSAFGTFAGEDFLSDVIRICFGVDIKEQDFCTDVCEHCLVKVDLVWKMYTAVESNSRALEDFYGSLKCETVPSQADNPSYDTLQSNVHASEIVAVMLEEPNLYDSSSSSSVQLNSWESASEDDDSYSLPEHPFFTEFSTSVYLCHLCPLRFEKAQVLHVHLDSIHPQDKCVKHLCQHCANFIHPNHLKKHIKYHESVKPVCEICGQAFGNSTNLRRHRLIHTKERPFCCTQCDATFNQSTLLKIHVRRVHLGIKPPKVKKASTPTKRRPVPCPICNEEFKLQSKLVSHLESAHPDHHVAVHHCDECSYKCVNQQALYKHRAYNHSRKEHESEHCGVAT